MDVSGKCTFIMPNVLCKQQIKTCEKFLYYSEQLEEYIYLSWFLHSGKVSHSSTYMFSQDYKDTELADRRLTQI